MGYSGSKPADAGFLRINSGGQPCQGFLAVLAHSRESVMESSSHAASINRSFRLHRVGPSRATNEPRSYAGWRSHQSLRGVKPQGRSSNRFGLRFFRKPCQRGRGQVHRWFPSKRPTTCDQTNTPHQPSNIARNAKRTNAFTRGAVLSLSCQGPYRSRSPACSNLQTRHLGS